MVRNRGKPHPLNGRSPLTVVVAASLLAGTIGSYSLIAPGGLSLLSAQGGRPGVVTASTPGQVAALMAYQRPAQGNADLLAGGNRPSVNRVVPPAGTAGGLEWQEARNLQPARRLGRRDHLGPKHRGGHGRGQCRQAVQPVAQ